MALKRGRSQSSDPEAVNVVRKKSCTGVKKVKVPQFYKEASRILSKYISKEGSLKSLVYAGKYRGYERVYGLLCRLVKNLGLVENIIDKIGLFKEEPRFNRELALVLTYEVLWKQSYLKGDSKPVCTVNKYAGQIFGTAHELGCKLQLDEKTSLTYVRFNTLVSSVDKIRTKLSKEGWHFKEYDRSSVSYEDFLQLSESLTENEFMADYHIPDLFLFHAKAKVWKSLLLKSGELIPQNKASCIPSYISAVEPGISIIDACAAPGNKTSHLAAMMCNKGTIIAFERDKARHKKLIELLKKRRVTCCRAYCRDFLNVDPSQYADVKVILLDPTCSASGTEIHSDEVNEVRVRKLASFQKRLLKHAMSFKGVQSIIYSTCSTNVLENEEVISEVLNEFGCDFEVIQHDLSDWESCGSLDFPFGGLCIRTDMQRDKCQGFFVAKLSRVNPYKEQEQRVTEILNQVVLVDKKVQRQLEKKRLRRLKKKKRKIEDKKMGLASVK